MYYVKDYLNMNKKTENVKFKSKSEVKVIYLLINKSDGERRRRLKLSYFGSTFYEF